MHERVLRPLSSAGRGPGCARSPLSAAIDATLALGGGGNGSAWKEGVEGGTESEGNSTTEGAPDANGTGVGQGDEAGIGDDDGASEGVEGRGGGSGDAEGSGDGGDGEGDSDVVEDDGLLADDGEGDDSRAGDDDVGGDDDGGLGTVAPVDPGGGPGAGAAVGSEPSIDDVAPGIGAVDRNKPAAPPAAPMTPAPADRGNAAIAPEAAEPAADGGDTGGAKQPGAELVRNANAARVMSMLSALGQPTSPEVVALMEVLIPEDLGADEVTALINELMLSLKPGYQTNDAEVMAILRQRVSSFVQRREARRNARRGGGSGSANRGGGGGVGASTKGPPPASGTSRAPDAKPVDRGRIVVKGAGLMPTVWEDGSVALTPAQLEQWIAVDGDALHRSKAGDVWVRAHTDQVFARVGVGPLTLKEVNVSGGRGSGDEFSGVLVFRLRGATVSTDKEVHFTFNPRSI